MSDSAIIVLEAKGVISYQWTTAFIGVAIAAKIFFLIRRDVLHARYAYWWLIVAFLALGGGLFPKLVDRIASTFGIAYPPILAVVVGVGLVLVKMLTMDLDRSRQEQRIRRLTQRLAILEADLELAQKSKTTG